MNVTTFQDALQFLGPIGSLCLPITTDATNQTRLSFPLALSALAASYSRCRRCLCIPCVSGRAGASSDWGRGPEAPQPLRCWMLLGLSPLTHLVAVPQEDWPRQYCRRGSSSSRKARWALWPPDIPAWQGTRQSIIALWKKYLHSYMLVLRRWVYWWITYSNMSNG